MKLTTRQGNSHPFGATLNENGCNFSLFSESAEGVTLVLYKSESTQHPTIEIDLDPEINKTFHIWHIHVEGVKAGWCYGYRIHGEWQPERGLRFQPHIVHLDPYSKFINRRFYNRSNYFKTEDNSGSCLRGVVLDTGGYDWEGIERPNTSMDDTIVYEMHVGGFTKSKTSKAKNPGTFSAIIDKIPHLKKLGVTAVEFLPVQIFDDTEMLREHDGKKLTNYWGYSTINFFALHPSFSNESSAKKAINEFRDCVKSLHAAGIEVILDVVFNHTDEGNHQGPSFSYKGIDNDTYYYLTGPNDSKEYYMDYTGCGNTFNCNHPVVSKLILDALDFWANDMGVDGFRFDEGSILSRDELGNPMKHPPVLWEIELSDRLSHVKLMTEAWDAAGLYQIGSFRGERYGEWNGKYRDAVRRFIKGDAVAGDFVARMTGSADLYEASGHNANNSVNFITVHDGFTLYDTVAYNDKHNWANGEGSNDGADDNYSWNCGYEGETDNPEINHLRTKQMKNLVASLMLSKGVPLMLSGDELARTQYGNNNTYCHDNELNWLDWSLKNKGQGKEMFRFFSEIIALRKRFSIHFGGHYTHGEVNKHGIPALSIFSSNGDQVNWSYDRAVSILYGDCSSSGSNKKNMLILCNMHYEPISFILPKYNGLNWSRVIDTALPTTKDIVKYSKSEQIKSNEYIVQDRSIVVLITK